MKGSTIFHPKICLFGIRIILSWLFLRNPRQKGFPGGSDGKESVCNAGDSGSVPGLLRSLGEGNATHSIILAWRIPWTAEPGRLPSIGVTKNPTGLSD